MSQKHRLFPRHFFFFFLIYALQYVVHVLTNRTLWIFMQIHIFIEMIRKIVAMKYYNQHYTLHIFVHHVYYRVYEYFCTFKFPAITTNS